MRANVIQVMRVARYFAVVSVLTLPATLALSQSPEWSISPERLTDKDDRHWPIQVELEDLGAKTDIVFATRGREEVTLDLYWPRARPSEAMPCVVAIHGGAWRVNTKAWFIPHTVYLARAGYVAATINYRKLPEHPLRACVEDAKASIRWLRANAAEIGIDPNRIGAMGGSAGGHLAAVLATTLERESRVNAAVAFAAADVGHPDMRHFYEELQLNEAQARELGAYPQIAKDSAPILLIHGVEDEVVPVTISQDIHRRYQQKRAHSELKLLDGYQHVFYVTPRFFFEAMSCAKDFFDRQFDRPAE